MLDTLMDVKTTLIPRTRRVHQEIYECLGTFNHVLIDFMSKIFLLTTL